MKVLSKFVLIEPTPSKEENRGGFLIAATDVAKERYKEAVVIQPGVDVTCVKEKDLIAFENASGHDIKIDGKFYTIIQERDIAIVL